MGMGGRKSEEMLIEASLHAALQQDQTNGDSPSRASTMPREHGWAPACAITLDCGAPP